MRSAQVLSWALFGLSACGPGSALSNADLTVTSRDPSFDFTTIKTYVLPATVEVVQSTDTPASSTTISATMSTFILDQISSHLDALGYQRLTNPSGPKPNVFLQAAVMQTTQTNVYYSGWSSYWGAFYDAWYAPGFATGFSPVVVPYVVQTTLASLIVNMTDPNHLNATDKTVPSPWVAVLNGAVTGEGEAAAQTRVQSGLNEAFAQSPYLAEGGS
jgi:hypothetical protein